jgi:hypothetical protein
MGEYKTQQKNMCSVSSKGHDLTAKRADLPFILLGFKTNKNRINMDKLGFNQIFLMKIAVFG